MEYVYLTDWKQKFREAIDNKNIFKIINIFMYKIAINGNCFFNYNHSYCRESLKLSDKYYIIRDVINTECDNYIFELAKRIITILNNLDMDKREEVLKWMDRLFPFPIIRHCPSGICIAFNEFNHRFEICHKEMMGCNY